DYLSTLLTLLTDGQADNAQADIVRSQTSMTALKAQIAKNEEELAKLSKPTKAQSEKLKALMATIEATEKRIAQHVRRIEAARAAIAARRAIVMAAFDVGVKKTEIAVSTAIAVSEIPNSKLIECWFKPNCNYNDMAGAPVAIENTLAEFKRLGFAISLDQLSTPPIAMDVPPEKNLTPRGRRKVHSNRSTLSKTQYVAYRDKEPFMRAFYKMSHPKVQPDSTPFSPVKREFKNLFTQRSPVGKVPYRVSSVGDRGMTLTFSNSGALISLKSTYTSSAKELGEAINQGLSQGLTNYKAAATTISEVNKLKREEELAEVAHKVSLLEKEKEVLEAHNNLGIAQMNTDDALRIAQINQELAVLAKEQELLQAQVNADVAGVTRPLTAEEQVLVAQQSLLLKQATLPLTTQTQILAAQDALKLAEATSPLAYETELIKAQLALLQQQQSLTPSGHQAELEKLNKLVENLITQVELLRQEKKVEDLKSEIDALQP
ncbi:MAG: hypothetical protein MI867_15475, partial [Pseudomonadales bacterium]|nr:hypothetical protein [Pseudomonadales bacterium]